MIFNFICKVFKNKPYKIAKTLECGFLNTNSIHKIYYETSGNPKGLPVVILHGGPGGSLSANKRKYYNPKKYYIIQFDQRGCGKSTPYAQVLENNTNALIEDMELLRKKLSIKKWVVAGSSWGSTLALAYSLVHKNKVLGLIINGVFVASKEELDSVYSPKVVVASMYPDEFLDFIKPLNKTESKNPLKSYLAKIENAQYDEEKIPLLKSFCKFNWLLCSMNPNMEFINKEISENQNIIDTSKIEIHYCANDYFIDSQEMLKSLYYLSDIPTYIVQGRYDLMCNPKTAMAVSQQIEDSKLVFTIDGHSIASNKGQKQFVAFTNELYNKIKEQKNV
jgi:proline iminopeptidase